MGPVGPHNLAIVLTSGVGSGLNGPRCTMPLRRLPASVRITLEHLAAMQAGAGDGGGFVVSRGLRDRGAQRMASGLATVDLTGGAPDPTEEEEEAAAGVPGGTSRAGAIVLDDDDEPHEDPSKELHAFEVDPAQVRATPFVLWCGTFAYSADASFLRKSRESGLMRAGGACEGAVPAGRPELPDARGVRLPQ